MLNATQLSQDRAKDLRAYPAFGHTDTAVKSWELQDPKEESLSGNTK